MLQFSLSFEAKSFLSFCIFSFVPHRRECQNAGIVRQGITEAVGVYIKEPREWCTAINSFATAEVKFNVKNKII